ncbi:uncharacterized protein HMPREF1541_09753 [Cyphellophora europaea CBS 101466]|uniref:RING-CH-type domain-containing protein n=1 Tax=Cyphellophora europaea (strain CBS 101466) TaxID=1220924 RepID=W2SA44_CYPE1|nr:uncharacterized protein HMPREF1541_09753 [Cyphellophora europaea CBS 101466]ETN44878.1 hypothetical protein HMPREF1541_09753 [Cyphellophora europaea CBS 101466]
MEEFIPGAFVPEPEPPLEPTPTVDPEPSIEPYPGWTYPTRMCRICREDVVATVTMYPPGLPLKYQRPVVEYKNEDEYGRLIRPCKCRGGMRYIHELCLLRSRTEGVRAGSLWKCHECGHQFNFKRMTVQRYLGSKVSSGLLTIGVMVIIVFFLGFVADPIINLYIDPYDTIVGNEPYWSEVDVATSNGSISGWCLHFLKGVISMGLVGFLKTALLNPFNFLSPRGIGFGSYRRSGTTTTGRDRAVNVSWIAVAIGIMSAFYFFYKWVQTIIGHTLTRIGNNIVDTSLPGDDDDLKPPLDYQPKPSGRKEAESAWQAAERVREAPSRPTSSSNQESPTKSEGPHTRPDAPDQVSEQSEVPEIAVGQRSQIGLDMYRGFSSALDDAREQGWSFVGIPHQR